jgi:hypothetical protein
MPVKSILCSMASRDGFDIPQSLEMQRMSNKPDNFSVHRTTELVDQARQFQGQRRSPTAEHRRAGGVPGALLASACCLYSGIAWSNTLSVPHALPSSRIPYDGSQVLILGRDLRDCAKAPHGVGILRLIALWYIGRVGHSPVETIVNGDS